MPGGAQARRAATSRAALAALPMTPNLTAGAHLPHRPGSDTIDRPVIVVGQQHRPVLQPFHVNRPADVGIVLNKAGYKGLNRFDCPVRVEERDYNIAADFLAFVPGAVAGNEDC